MGCGFCCVVAAGDEQRALDLLRSHHPDATVIGRATDRPGKVLRLRAAA
jgi:phosphoribosylaminoimidazole (AIR) synthetase